MKEVDHVTLYKVKKVDRVTCVSCVKKVDRVTCVSCERSGPCYIHIKRLRGIVGVVWGSVWGSLL